MIIEVRAKNCYAFEDDITFSMKADMRNKKFGANVHKENNDTRSRRIRKAGKEGNWRKKES